MEPGKNLSSAVLAEIDQVFAPTIDVELTHSPASHSEASDEEETVVKKFEFDGKTYLKDADNCLFDQETQEHIGNYNAAGSCIDYVTED